MKIRSGFVSNSSSSSFICEICGEGDTYMDSIGLDDIEMCQCVNEHLMCQNHLKPEALENGVYDIPEEFCPICQFEEYSEDDMYKYMEKTYKIPESEVLVEIKKVNKRRRKVYTNEYIEYVAKHVNKTVDKIFVEIREKYKTYSAFKSYLY